jgi:hypothetical protein
MEEFSCIDIVNTIITNDIVKELASIGTLHYQV